MMSPQILPIVYITCYVVMHYVVMDKDTVWLDLAPFQDDFSLFVNLADCRLQAVQILKHFFFKLKFVHTGGAWR
ncbi:MAG: hypothetical protein A6F71_04940 [Cycloclasticus sp. symbiont of Poecilosclerida sp. M]|nr:MAG: hypothetical protein A6F71_04940 [Cycloclasticus sp. symbiont of Poecilosclerida sp. M]